MRPCSETVFPRQPSVTAPASYSVESTNMTSGLAERTVLDASSAFRSESDLHPHTAQPQRRRTRRAVFLTWLRKIHLYVGLWGAVLGLLFGMTGLLMNHRAILKIPFDTKAAQKTVQLPVPAQGFASADQLATWLQSELGIKPAQPPIIKLQPAKKVVWDEREVMQPERWSVMLLRPQSSINAEYFTGNRFVKVEQVESTPLGTLMRLHTATGVSAFWVLLADTIAGSMILLSITGLLLWTQLHTIRTAAVMTSVGALCAALWFLWTI